MTNAEQPDEHVLLRTTCSERKCDFLHLNQSTESRVHARACTLIQSEPIFLGLARDRKRAIPTGGVERLFSHFSRSVSFPFLNTGTRSFWFKVLSGRFACFFRRALNTCGVISSRERIKTVGRYSVFLRYHITAGI